MSARSRRPFRILLVLFFRRSARQALLVDASDEPGELFRGDLAGLIAVARPGEVTLVQAWSTEPDAVTVTHEYFQAGTLLDGEDERIIAFRCRMPLLSHPAGEGVDAVAHVDKCRGAGGHGAAGEVERPVAEGFRLCRRA